MTALLCTPVGASRTPLGGEISTMRSAAAPAAVVVAAVVVAVAAAAAERVSCCVEGGRSKVNLLLLTRLCSRRKP